MVKMDMVPSFIYDAQQFSAKDISYDLAKIYAKSKLDYMLQIGHNFDIGLASEEIEQVEYLLSQFLLALDYLAAIEPGDYERLLSNR